MAKEAMRHKQSDEEIARGYVAEAKALVPLSEQLKNFAAAVAKPFVSFVSDTMLKNEAEKQIDKTFNETSSKLEAQLRERDEYGQTRLAKGVEELWNELRQKYDDAKLELARIYGGKKEVKKKKDEYGQLVASFREKAARLGQEESEAG